MSTPEKNIEELSGRLFALEGMLTHLIWMWAVDQPHPPSAVSRYFRPLEESMAKMAADPAYQTDAMAIARNTLRGVAEELERTLHAEAVRRTDETGPVQ